VVQAINWIERALAVGRGVLAEHAADVDGAGRWPREGIAALASEGFLGLTLPRTVGGAEQGPAVFLAVTQALAEHCASTAMIYLMHICAAQTIAAAAQDFALQSAILADMAAGKHLSTLAFSEKGSRSHFWAPMSQAVAAGDHHRLSALKSWVTSAGHADSYVVSTRAAGAAEPMTSTLYFVPRGASGLAVSGKWDGLGLRGNASAPMKLEQVLVPASARLSGDGQGFQVMIELILPWFQLGSAAVSLGISRSATAATRQHLANAKFEHLSQSLASLMNLRARLAQMQIAADTLAAFLESVAEKMAHPGPETMLAVLESKAAAAETALQVTDLAMRTCGGAAFSRHLPIERNFRDARAAAVMAPTTDVLHDFVGKALLGLPLF
jgi:alkylation response protein AidB-like acyl-CoA dehydrogenase